MLFVSSARAKVNGESDMSQNVAAIHTVVDEGWPYIAQDGKEL